MKEEFLNIPLVKNEKEHRFEIVVEGSIAFIDYKETHSQIALIHTEVPKEIGGKGVAAALVEKTMNYLEKHHNSVLPFCPYVFAYIKKHPEWKRIVDKSFKGYDKLIRGINE